jgi:hypothetical protein
VASNGGVVDQFLVGVVRAADAVLGRELPGPLGITAATAATVTSGFWRAGLSSAPGVIRAQRPDPQPVHGHPF